MKSNLPLRVDQNTTLVDVTYERTHSTYWYAIDTFLNKQPLKYVFWERGGEIAHAMSPRRARKADFDGLDDAGCSVRNHQQRIVEPTAPEGLTGHKATEGGRRRKRLRHPQKERTD